MRAGLDKLSGVQGRNAERSRLFPKFGSEPVKMAVDGKSRSRGARDSVLPNAVAFHALVLNLTTPFIGSNGYRCYFSIDLSWSRAVTSNVC